MKGFFMKLNMFKYGILAAFFTLGFTACDDFLDRPNEDAYNENNYYQTDAQVNAGVYYLYSSPWYDFQRGYFKVGEVLSGNLYMGQSPYLDFTVNGTDQDLVNMSCSFWSVIAHSNTVYNSIKNAPSSITESVRNQCMGECLVWKAMAYFYLVRTFGDIPIVHDNTQALAAGDYNEAKKIKRADVYEYIIMTLEKAMEIMPQVKSTTGRIDYYGAEALLAKVYLAKAGVSGTLNAQDLENAAKYAKDVIDNSGYELLPDYADNFKLVNNVNSESLIAWRWSSEGNVWTAQNSLQCDLGMTGTDEFGDDWGDWTNPSVDLQEAFGIKLVEQTPDAWINNVDTRLKATMMLPGFTYDYMWTDKTYGGNKTGFSYLDFMFNTTYNKAAPGELRAATGANCVKHLYGNTNDHVKAVGHSPAYMANSLATHLLRLSDVYLIYVEAKLGASRATSSDADVLDKFYAVHHRAVPSAQYPQSVSWEDVWKERRLEFALEGDRWYDFVRVSYYDPDFVINELSNQKRNTYYNIGGLYEEYYETGNWTITENMRYDADTSAPNPVSIMKTDKDTGKRYLLLPFPTEDVVFNHNLASDVDGENLDVRNTYSY